MKITFYFTLFILTVLAPSLCAQDLNLYTVGLYENDAHKQVAFTSLSETYPLSDDPDSLAMPSLEGMTEQEAQYILLDSIYRNGFLTTMNLSETDTVFIYDYAQGMLYSFPIKTLNLVAIISIYEPNGPYRQEDFEIGFEIDAALLSDHDPYFLSCLAAVGKENPFEVGKLESITWMKTDRSNFPSIPIDFENAEILFGNNFFERDVYMGESNDLQYFIQEYADQEHVAGRHLIVIDVKTSGVLCDRLFFEDEGSTLTELNSLESYPSINQYTGKLLKNKPLVVFGFKYVGFGCEFITFLQPGENDLYLKCDNRH